MARLIGAGRVGFFLLQGESLALQEAAFGIEPPVSATLSGIPCRKGGDSAAERIVFGGAVVNSRAGDGFDLEPYRRWLAPLRPRDGLAVRWAAGDEGLGLVAALDSSGSRGFTEEDEWTLQVAAATAGLVWKQRQLASQVLAAKSEENERMQVAALRLGELEEMKRRILNLAAHELRGPIAVIRGYLSMIADESIDERGLRRILPILVGKAAQMDSLVTQMLEVARLEEGKLELNPESLDLGEIAREVVDVAALLAPPGLLVFFEHPSPPVRVKGDRVRLATIIGNLIDNAIKYSPNGGTVRCSIGSAGDRLYFRVRDQGLGISADDLPSLFTRFGRIVTTENSHIPGTGLGLHLSRELARLHGGDITVESQVGAGSTFTLWLPPG